jgi:hypothetical protein
MMADAMVGSVELNLSPALRPTPGTQTRREVWQLLSNDLVALSGRSWSFT